jgi:hypothetical protein
MAPFNLSTETRGRQRKEPDRSTKEEKAAFRAKPMPSYKFFEVNKDAAAKEAKFEPFNLKTTERSESRKRASLPSDEAALRKTQTFTFKATKMPDFSDTYNGLKPPSPKKLTMFQPFKLSTLSRGAEKE